MRQQGKTTEPSFNEALGAALRASVVRWREAPETGGIVHVEKTGMIAGAGNRGKHLDILILDPTFRPVAIETSFDGNDADKDACNRLGLKTEMGGLLIETAFAVHVPARFRNIQREEIQNDLLNGAELAYSVHQRNIESGNASTRWPKSGFITGTAADLAHFVPVAALPKEIIEQTAQKVAEQVEWAADRIGMATTPEQQAYIAGAVHQRTLLKGLRVTMVLWLNALLTQRRLHAQGSGIPPLESCLDGQGHPVPSELSDVWKQILETNWRSIFEPAHDVLRNAAGIDASSTSEALSSLMKAVEKIELAKLGTYINVGAELFPKLSDDRKQAAAYYTQPATAEFLATLTISHDSLPDGVSWEAPDLWAKAKFADLACGTGTLLRAGYRRIAAFHEQSASATIESVANLHRNAMESGIFGTDISPIAAHLTSSSLAAIGSGEPYGDTQIGWVKIGGRSAKTGALEFFRTAELSDLFETVGSRSTGTEPGEAHITVDDGTLAWVLMNPPYSRTRGGQSAFDVAGLTEDERKACQDQWKKLTQGHAANNQAGMAASFVALAHQKLVPAGGRMGFVLPLTAAFADTWTDTRKLVEGGYEDIIAVAISGGKALGKDALSADTDMEEMMLVATKRPFTYEPLSSRKNPKRAIIRCITLYEPLRDAAHAREIARAVTRAVNRVGGPGSYLPIQIGNDEIGIVSVLETEGSGSPWSTLGARNIPLAFGAIALAKGELRDPAGSNVEKMNVGFTRMEDLFSIGPTHHLIGHIIDNTPIGAFEFHPLTQNTSIVGENRALWAADSKRQKKLVVAPTHRGVVPRELEGRDQEGMREQASSLFYARNLRWTSQALLAASTQRPAMGGSSWTALKHNDPRVLKAFALWANSTFGLLIQWSRGQRTHSGRSRIQVKALKKIPVPCLDMLSGETLDTASEIFDRLEHKNLLPACQAHVDPARKEIDQAVIRMLGLPARAEDIVHDLRRMWCEEPSVHGGNKAALQLLM